MSTLRSPAGPPFVPGAPLPRRRIFCPSATPSGILTLIGFAVEREVHRRAEDGVAEVDGELGFEIAAALGAGLESAPPPPPKRSEKMSVNPPPPPPSRASAALRARRRRR